MTTAYQCRAYDRVAITQRSRTKDGYLMVPATIAASDNVQAYLAGELGIKGVPPATRVRVFRPKAVVDAAAASAEGKPLTLEHPSRMVDAKIWKAVARGDAHNVRPTATGLDADLLVKDEVAIRSIESREREELSAAYDFKLTMLPGVAPHGEAYDAVASDMDINHIAIVRKGRSRTPDGKPCRVADSNKGDRKMRTLVFDAALLGTTIPTQLPEMEDGVASAVDGVVRSLAQARDAAVTERDSVLEECARRLEAQAKDHAAELQTLRDGLPALVEAAAADRASVLSGAAKIGLELKAEGKDTATLRREVLAIAIAKDGPRKTLVSAIVPDVAKASDEALGHATAALFAVADQQVAPRDTHRSLSTALAGKRLAAADSAPEPKTGRAAAMEASANAWRRTPGKSAQ